MASPTSHKKNGHQPRRLVSAKLFFKVVDAGPINHAQVFARAGENIVNEKFKIAKNISFTAT
ncbi:MAG: hypothetical protein P8H92_10570 [Paracoccaceae bacterium]|nr:hypothetical protein [Paracoccaceae bacterium]